MTDETRNKREQIAFAMWSNQAERAAPNIVKYRTPEAFASEDQKTRDEWLGYADAALAVLDAPPAQPVAVEGNVWVWLSRDGRVRSASNEAPSADHIATATVDGDRIIPFAPYHPSAAPTDNAALVEAWMKDCEQGTDTFRDVQRNPALALEMLNRAYAIFAALASREAAAHNREGN